ncbi:MAG: FumA C-terminus/TtdB family hydratase beta subunit [Candidatus Hydrothermarchaeales archaeon]
MHINLPVTGEDAKRLELGDEVYLSGVLVTARDRAHKRALELDKDEIPVDFNVIYHCGPLVRKGDGWEIISAGPTTSSRMESYIPDLLKKFKTKIIIGKGGIKGEEAIEALQKEGSVYLSFTGGCGVLAAGCIRKIREVHWLDLGIPEALWLLEVENFGPLTVSIDSRGNSLYRFRKLL